MESKKIQSDLYIRKTIFEKKVYCIKDIWGLVTPTPLITEDIYLRHFLYICNYVLENTISHLPALHGQKTIKLLLYRKLLYLRNENETG